MKSITGVLLVNLGTPLTPAPKDVFKYLNQFLTDGRVIDIPPVQRNLVVRGIIVPFRHRKSAAIYQKIWTEKGSPLLFHSQNLAEKVQDSLGDQYKVVLAMRYQEPSIKAGLEELQKAMVKEIILIPLFPQYASATNGSVIEEAMKHIQKWQVIPNLRVVNSFYDHPKFLQGFIEIGKKYDPGEYDHVLFSYHGLPERQIHKADPDSHCLKTGCCDTIGQVNQFCYRAQCFATTRSLAKALNLHPDNYTTCFQSRLGRAEWIKPYASDTIEALAKAGKKRLLVFSPAFVADCLETIYEIGVEYDEEFRELGGEKVQLVESLNALPLWVECVKELILDS